MFAQNRKMANLSYQKIGLCEAYTNLCSTIIIVRQSYLNINKIINRNIQQKVTKKFTKPEEIKS